MARPSQAEHNLFQGGDREREEVRENSRHGRTLIRQLESAKARLRCCDATAQSVGREYHSIRAGARDCSQDGARPFRTAAAEEDTPDLTTTSRRLPLLIGTTSLRIAVHHSLVIVEIHKIEELFRRAARPGQSKLGLVLIPKIGSEWPAGATVNQTIVLTQRRKRVGRMDSSRKLWMDCGAWSKAEMACCRRADLHEVPLLGSSSKDLCAVYGTTYSPPCSHLVGDTEGYDARTRRHGHGGDSSAREGLQKKE